MRRIIFSLVLFLSIVNLYGQQWSVSLTMNYYPPADLYVWETHPNVGVLSITNTGFSSKDVIINFNVTRQDAGQVLKASSKNLTFMPGETQVYTTFDFIDWNTVQYSSVLKNTVVQTGQLPEGSYSICADITAQEENLGQSCSDFQILVADPPFLLSPEHLSTIETTLPFFQWTPCNVLPPLTVDYKFKLVELLPGQAVLKALSSNPPVYEITTQEQAFLQYPSDAFELEEGKSYAWHVQAVTGANSNAPVTFKNNGMSEQRSFKILKQESALELVSPSNNSTISPQSISQYSKGYKFIWGLTNFNKSITSYVIKIAEVLPGQTPESALKINTPVYLRDNILPAVHAEYIGENSGILLNQKKYAWRVYINSVNWGGIIDSSEVWSFTASNGFEIVKLISPENAGFLEADTLHSPSKNRTYQFIWSKQGITKSITSFSLRIAEVHSGQTPSQALAANPAVLFKDDLNPAYVHYTLDESLGLLKDQQKYAWQVKASSTQWGGLVALSEAREFTIKNGITQIDSIDSFIIGNYKVTVKSITNKNSQSFGGKGEINLWNSGPAVQFDFDKLKLTSQLGSDNKQIWKASGDIWKTVVVPDIALTSELKGQISLKINTLRLSETISNVYGSVRIKSNLLIKEYGTPANVIIESGTVWFDIHPVKRISSETVMVFRPKQEYKFTLLKPLNFDLSISSLKSEFRLVSNQLYAKFWGELFLPQAVKNMKGERISIRFFDAPDFKFDTKINDITHIRLVNSSDIMLVVKEASIDLYGFGVTAKAAEIAFDYHKTNIPNIPVTLTDDFRITSTGLNGSIKRTAMNFTGLFRGYSFKASEFNIRYANNVMVQLWKIPSNHLKGKILIPFLSTEAEVRFSINQDGLSSGIVNISGWPEWINIYGGQPGDALNLQLKIMGQVVYFPYQNIFILSGYFRYTSPTIKGLSTDNLPVSNFVIDSTGKVGVMGSVDGWCNLSVNKPGKYNGFPVTIDKFRALSYGINYSFGVSGTIVLADNLSSQNGSPFSTTLTFAGLSGFGKSGAEAPSGEVSTEPIPVDFGNSESEFGASLKWFDDDPVYGKGFMASVNLTMHNPTDFSVFSKVIIGKTNNGTGFSYWFVEAGAEFPFAITTGIGDLGIKGFTGRVYSHMKHSGNNVLASDYVPDKDNVFGVYAMCPFMSTSDDGSKIWGKTALEIMIGKGFKSILYGEVDILSSGYKEDGKIKGNATITVSTSPPMFDATVNVSANFWDGLCGQGTMQMHISETEWFLNVGTKEKPITVNMFCGPGGAYGYFEINQNYIAMGAGYSFDTGPQKWGAGLGCYGRASGSINMSGQLNYKPFSVVASADMHASGEIGVYVDVKVFTGYLCVLSGEMGAAMQVQFPDPVCFAGEVYAKACIKACLVGCRVCAGAHFKIRYKDGSFALKSSCDT